MSKRIDRLTDEIAILEYRSGDVEAFGRLMRRWQKRIFRYIFAILADEHHALDVSQEVWMAVVAMIRRRREVKNFPALIYAIARNKSFSHLRKYKRRHRTTSLGEGEQTLAAPGSQADQVETSDFVRSGLGELSVEHREALTLFYLEGMSIAEIAGILHVPDGTVRSRLHNGREKLRAVFSVKGYHHE